MAIKQTLQKLGLNDKEINIYLTLLKNGKTKPSDLAIMTKINRPTLYNLANSLVSKGVIAEDMGGKIMHLVPLSPNNLGNILEQTKRDLKEKENLVKKAIEELSLITADKTYPVPKVRFIKEGDLEKFLFDNLIKWQEEVISTDGVWWGFQDHSFVENYEKWIHLTWQTKQSKNENYQAKVFSNISDIEKKIKEKYPKSKRDIKFFYDMNFTATTWVCGNYLIMVSTRQHPFYLFEIYDQTLAHNMREVLKKLWTMTVR